MTITVDASCGNDAAERAQAYVALVGMLGFELDPPVLGAVIEKWALFMAGSHVASKCALIAALRVHAERCPLVSLSRACETLHLDACDVLGVAA